MIRHRNLKGLAFDIADLQALQSWARQNDVGMDIRLDHGVDDEEYEEVIAFHTDATGCFLLMWRTPNTIVVQPLPGRQLHCPSVNAALSRLHVRSAVPVTP
jgi:hypothetical protein